MENEDLKNLSERLEKFIEYLGISANKFGEFVDISSSHMSKILSGTNPGVDKILKIVSKYPQLNADWLLRGRGEMLLGKEDDSYLTGEKIRAVPVALSEKDEGKIILVTEKAAAGYLHGYADPEYIKTLPTFSLPGMSEGVAFEIQGDSMEPYIYEKDLVACTYIQNWYWIKDGELYVIVSPEQGIVVKYVKNNLKKSKELVLESENDFYKPYTIKAEEISHVLKVKHIITSRTRPPAFAKDYENRILKLEEEMQDVKQAISKINLRDVIL